jgi:hypothetical protein
MPRSVRRHKYYHTTGSGHVYQNRFKACPVADDDHLLTVLRYVERNALRAGVVERAEDSVPKAGGRIQTQGCYGLASAEGSRVTGGNADFS